MPLVLENGQLDDWMRGPSELAAGMMKPYGGAIEAWAVDRAVGNLRNNRPELMERAVSPQAARAASDGPISGLTSGPRLLRWGTTNVSRR